MVHTRFTRIGPSLPTTILRTVCILVMISWTAHVRAEECRISTTTWCQCQRVDKTLIIDCGGKNLELLPHIPTDMKAEHVHLNVSHNTLKTVDYPQEYNQRKVTVLDLSHNHLTEFNVIAEEDTQSLEALKLNDNNLKTLSNVTIESLSHIEHRNLSNNPWNCTCNKLEFLKELQDLDGYARCSRGNLVGEFMDDCRYIHLALVICFFVFSALLSIILCFSIIRIWSWLREERETTAGSYTFTNSCHDPCLSGSINDNMINTNSYQYFS